MRDNTMHPLVAKVGASLTRGKDGHLSLSQEKAETLKKELATYFGQPTLPAAVQALVEFAAYLNGREHAEKVAVALVEVAVTALVALHQLDSESSRRVAQAVEEKARQLNVFKGKYFVPGAGGGSGLPMD